MEITPQYVELVTAAHEYLTDRQNALKREFNLGQWPRYDWSQDTRQLVFSEDGVPRVIADVQFVGSISTRSQTWLWAWANESVDAALSAPMTRVRDFGASLGIDQLTTAQWEASETDGWEMTSIAAFFLQSCGAYRSPGDDGFTYMVMSAIRWADGTGR
jgi:hypothetical protein